MWFHNWRGHFKSESKAEMSYHREWAIYTGPNWRQTVNNEGRKGHRMSAQSACCALESAETENHGGQAIICPPYPTGHRSENTQNKTEGE